MNKYLLPVCLILFSAGCRMTQTIHYPYNQVSQVLKEKFVEHYDDFVTSQLQLNESKGSIEISFNVDVDFYFSILPDISVKKKDSRECEIAVTITEYYKSWSYQSRNKKLEKEFIATLEKRLETGKWEKLPWEKKENLNPSVFSAIFRRVSD